MNYWQESGLDSSDAELQAAENRRRVALFQDGRHVEIAGAGHMIHYDEPRVLNSVLQQFLASAVAGSA